MPFSIDGRFLTPEQFRIHVKSLVFTDFRPVGIVWHNTAEPSLKLWHQYSRQHWMNGLADFYSGKGWRSGPHLFIDDGEDGIGLFTPLNERGVHSPSFNAQYIGIEHVGDYSSEDDDSGPGLQIKQNGIAATAILCDLLRISADPIHIKLHKEDPRTDHDCPGKNMAEDKLKSIQTVVEYIGTAGDHDPNWAHVVDNMVPTASRKGIVVVDNDDTLSVRENSTISSSVQARLNNGETVDIVSQALNGSSLWYCIARPHNSFGWVNARFIKEVT